METPFTEIEPRLLGDEDGHYLRLTPSADSSVFGLDYCGIWIWILCGQEFCSWFRVPSGESIAQDKAAVLARPECSASRDDLIRFVTSCMGQLKKVNNKDYSFPDDAPQIEHAG